MHCFTFAAPVILAARPHNSADEEPAAGLITGMGA